jgi:hypothetical protein
MSRSNAAAPLGTEFDAFLFAPVKEESNGMILTVVSVLARLNIDPWREAAELARLPRESARKRLVSMIGSLPGVSQSGGQTQKIADGLISLLPHGARPAMGTGAQAASSPRETMRMVAVSLLIMASLLGALWASNHVPPEFAGTTQPPASGKILPPG